MILLKKIGRNEWWSTSNCWTSDEAQVMVFAKVSDAVDCALLREIKDARVVVMSSPVNWRTLKHATDRKPEAAPFQPFPSTLQTRH